MKRSLKLLMSALAALVLPALGWAELPTAVWTWNGSGGTATGVLPSGETVYTANNQLRTIDSLDTKAFTFAFWGKLHTSAWQDLAGFATSGGGFKLERRKGTDLFAMYEIGGSGLQNADLTLSESECEYYAFVNNAGTVTIYKNGEVVGTVTTTTWEDAISGEGKKVYIGLGCSPTTSGGTDRAVTSTFSDVKVYASALTAEEVKAVYEDYATRAAAMAYQRTVTGDAEWSATDAWTLNEEKSAAPAEGKPVHLTVNADSTITMNDAATVGALTIDGSAKATFAGDQTLTATSTAIKTNVDVSQMTAEADLGAVTIAKDKTLTGLASKTITSSLAGEGTYELGATAADTEYAPSWAAASTTPIKWTKGKLTFATGSNGSGYPKNAPLTVTGADAQMVLKTSTDTTGYNGGSASLTIADGAKLVVEKRDTFNRPLILNNASMTLSGDNLDSSRSIDFYTNSSLTSSGTSSITGANATANDYGDNTVGSGIIAIRRANLEIAVNDGTLSCYAQFGGADGYGNAATGVAVKKTGSGTLALYRAANNNVPAQVNAGTLKLVNDGGLSNNSYTIADGATLAVSVIADKTKTMATTFNGPGKIVKQDAGTLDLGDATFGATSPAFEVEGGMLILPAGAEGTETDGVITSRVTVAEGAKVGIRLTAEQIASSYTAKVADGTTVEFYDGTTKLESEGTTYTCPVPVWKPTGSTLTFDSTDCWSGGEVPAEGAIVIDTSAYTGEDAIALVVSKSYSSITVVGNTEKVTAISFADGVTIAPAISINGKVKVPFAALGGVSVADGSVLIVDVASDAELTAVPSGTYAFWKDGAGILTLNTNLTPANGTKILAGTIKYGSSYIGNNQNSADDDVTVCNGAALDFGGKVDGFTRYVTLEAGATLKNTGGNIGADKRQLAGVILTGDATIENSGNFGLIAGGWGATLLTLNGHTLTKKGTGAFWLCSTTVDNGTIKIEDGRIAFENDTTSTLGDITLDVAGDNVWQRTAGTVNYNGTITKQGAGSVTIDQVISASKTITVGAGTLKLTAANTRSSCATIIESGATLDLTTAGATLYNASNYTGNGYLTVRGTLQVASDSAYGSFATRYDGTTLDGGTLEIAGDITCDRCFNTTENGGSILVREGYTYAINAYSGQEANWAFIFKVNIDGTLTKKGNGTLVLHTPVTGYKYKENISSPSAAPTELSSGGITVEAGTLVLNGANTYAGETTIASGATLSGTGTIPAGLTLANGATINASANKITVTGDVTLPAEGTVTVTLPAEPGVGTEVLACANAATLDLTKLSNAPDGLKWVAEEGIIELATAAVCKIGETEYETLAAALEDAEAGTEITMVADSDESITLPAGVKLIMGGYTVASVKDVYGANLTVDTAGNYTGPTYIAKASGMGLAETGYASFQEAVNAAAGVMGTVTLLADLEINAPITINNNEAWFIIDLGGKTLTATGSSAIYVKDGNVTIQNGTINATAVGIWICDKTTNAEDTAFDFSTNPYGNASVTLDSTLKVTSSTDNCVLMYNGAVLSTAAALTSSGEYATIQGTGLNANNATMINITGGSVTSTDNHAIYHPQPGTLTITGGTVSGKTGIEMRAGTLDMQGGTVTATGAYVAPVANGDGSTVEGAAIVLSQHTTGEEVTANITGGTITADNGKTFVVANTTNAEEVKIDATIEADVTIDTTKVDITIPTMELKAGAEGGYTLEDRTTGATIGNAWYETLQEAVDAATAGQTITLLGDMTLAACVDLDADDEIVLDLNGKTITENVDNQYGAIYVRKGAKLTITGEGKIATDGGIVIGNYGTVIVAGGTIEAGANADADVSIYNFYFGADYYGTTEVTGGTVARIWNCGIVDITAGTVAHLDNSGAAEITGGTVTAITLRDGSDAAEVADAGVLTAPEGLIGSITTEDGFAVSYAGGKYTVAHTSGALVGDEWYASLAAAVAEAEEGDTLKLLGDETLADVVKIETDVTIDLNGKIVTAATGKNALWAYNADLIITDTAEGGKVVAAGAQAVRVGDNSNTATAAPATFTLNGGAIEGKWAVTIWEDSTVTVNGGTITGSSYGISGNGYNHGTTITVEAGTISGGVCGIYHPQAGELTINGGSITGATGIEMRAGTITMTAGTVKTTADAYDEAPNGNGSTTVGAALALSQHGGVESITVNITGGEIVGSDSTADDAPVAIAITNTTSGAPATVTGTVATTAVKGGVETDEAFNVDEDGEGNLKFSTGTPVAKIGDTVYYSIDSAIDAADEGAEIRLRPGTLPIYLDEAVEVAKKVIINLNGAIIMMTEKDEAGDGIFHVTAGGDLTINGDGTLVPLGKNDYCMAIWADGGKVTINGGTYNNLMSETEAASKKDPNHFDLIYAKNGGQVEINGGHFLCQTPAWTLNSHDTLRGNIIVQGGTFKEFDPANCATEGEGTDWVAEGYSSLSEEKTYNNQTATFYTVTNASAKIGDETYDTLADAYAAAADNATITLLGHDTGTGLVIEKPITIDFNGKTYTVNHAVGSSSTATLGMQINAATILTSTATAKGKLTCLPCNLAYGAATVEAVAGCGYTSEKPVRMLINNYADLTVTNVILDGSNLAPNKNDAAHYVLSNNSGDVTIDANAEIIAEDGDYAFDVCKYASYDAPTVTVAEDATIGGKVEVSGGKLDNDSSTALDVVISSGTVEGSVTVDTTKSTYLVEVDGVYCNKAVDAEGKDATDAVKVFTGIATGVDGTTAKVDWDFGISKIEPGTEDGMMDITVKVQKDAENAAGYAAGVTVAIVDANGDVIGTATTAANGEAVITVELDDLKDGTTGEAKTFKAKASK